MGENDQGDCKKKRFAGPFKEIPFNKFIQSPVGLVPKDGGKQTRLIFHLSYDFKESGLKSVNHYIPDEICSVKYKDLDQAVLNCLKLLWNAAPGAPLWFGKSDLKSAFRILGLKKSVWLLLVMKVRHPETDEIFYFVDKCLPFGSSISCALFQKFSDSLVHILQFKTGQVLLICPITNYLDDFLFIQLTKMACNGSLKIFLEMCAELNVPVSMDKTEWATNIIIFLGILLNGKHYLLAVPEEKKAKALFLLKSFVDKKKALVRQIQSLAGLLNFLNKAIFPGRTFTAECMRNLAIFWIKMAN